MAYTEKENTVEVEGRARKGAGKMKDEELRALMGSMLGDAVSYNDTELGPARAKATRYYNGEKFGNEEEGRSQVVMTEVHDQIQAILPSILRVIFSSDKVLEYEPRNPGAEASARQATDFIQDVFVEKNAGFLQTHAVLKDGLTRKLGIFKWGWDDAPQTRSYRVRGVSQSDLVALLSDEDVGLDSVEIVQAASPATELSPGTEEMYDAEITYTDREGRGIVMTVPTDEFLHSREGRTVDDALLVAHRTEKTRGELIAMGIDESVIDEHGGTDDGPILGEEAQARAVSAAGATRDAEAGEANDKILYIEAYPRIDYNGDGVAELRKVCTIGHAYYPVMNEPCRARPFAIFCPDPEPHAIIGRSWYDRTADMQLVKSMLTRGMLDSLSLSIFPRVAYVEGQVSVADLLNNEIGAPIRERISGAARPFAHTFVGKETLPVLGYMDEQLERRTGQEKGAVGLDADALQSTTKDGVNAAVTASQAQVELLARIFAEATLKPMFKGMLQMYVEHRPRKQTVRLRGEWVDIDPRVWDANMDVRVNVALGNAHEDKKLQTLLAIEADQRGIIEQYGPMNPMVTLAMHRNTKARITALRGYPNTAEFYKPVPEDWQPPPPPPPPPSPEVIAAQAVLEAEKMKSQVRMAELQQKAAEAQLEHDLKMQQLAAETALKKLELELKYDTDIQDTMVDAAVKREKTHLDSQTKLAIAKSQQEMQREESEHRMMIETAKTVHDGEMKERQVENAEKQARAKPVKK